ncbi:MAG: fumarate hydratase C-terminal domain-containing protein, partial [Candidatus Cloacimonetes bacterium]|nr:fumarate hydratase C-terminal domain-containing protein [Candidatus Cloacimonadota bacterium]
MREIKLSLPIRVEQIRELKRNDKILLSGDIYTARDLAHKRFMAMIERGESLPVCLAETAIFYCGPSPAGAGQICGAVGPTTSYRMDRYVQRMLEQGLRIMIGKGDRSEDTERLIREYGALYLTCVGGISAVLNQHIVSCETYLWPELGAEGVYH